MNLKQFSALTLVSVMMAFSLAAATVVVSQQAGSSLDASADTTSPQSGDSKLVYRAEFCVDGTDTIAFPASGEPQITHTKYQPIGANPACSALGNVSPTGFHSGDLTVCQDGTTKVATWTSTNDVRQTRKVTNNPPSVTLIDGAPGPHTWAVEISCIPKGNIYFGPDSISSGKTATVYWQTVQPVIGKVTYTKIKSADGSALDPATKKEVAETTAGATHMVVLDGLDAQTTYYYQVDSASVVATVPTPTPAPTTSATPSDNAATSSRSATLNEKAGKIPPAATTSMSGTASSPSPAAATTSSTAPLSNLSSIKTLRTLAENVVYNFSACIDDGATVTLTSDTSAAQASAASKSSVFSNVSGKAVGSQKQCVSYGNVWPQGMQAGSIGTCKTKVNVVDLLGRESKEIQQLGTTVKIRFSDHNTPGAGLYSFKAICSDSDSPTYTNYTQ